ncbi:hypothetical protein D3C87_2039850 [compost metagenome]
MATFHDRLTMFAGQAQVDCRAVDFRGLVIQRARQNAGSGGFTNSTNASQHIGLRNSPSFERVGQRADHRLLANHQI